MSVQLSASVQGRWKDSFASSPKVGLTVRANGEEPVMVFTPQRALVPAGFDAPTAAPTVADGGAGALAAGYVGYRYVYASSQYPNVEAIVAAGGLLYPKSNPSPGATVYQITASHQNIVTVTKTTRSDVDTIFVYRTLTGVDAATAKADSDAGNLYYVGSVKNNGIAGTALFADNVPAPQEQLELDNYTAPLFWLCVYEPPYWWGFGNPQLNLPVTLDGSSTFTLTDGSAWFGGRNGQQLNFDGVTTGGVDGKGTYYFKQASLTSAQAFFDAALTQPATFLPSGTTTARLRGYSGTLYRSKPNNPFAWGWTESQISSAGGVQSVLRVPQQYAFNVGGSGSAIAVLSTERILKLDVENPPRCFGLSLQLAGTSGFEASLRTLDARYSVSCHHSQFAVTLPNGYTALRGLDAKTFNVVQASAASQIPISNEVSQTLRLMAPDAGTVRLFHGVFDPKTELSVFWIKISRDSTSLPQMRPTIDTALCYHGPTGQWSTLDDMDVTASAAIYDPVADETIALVGTGGYDGSQQQQVGFIKRAFSRVSTLPQTITITSYGLVPDGTGRLQGGNASGIQRGEWIFLECLLAGQEGTRQMWALVEDIDPGTPALAIGAFVLTQSGLAGFAQTGKLGMVDPQTFYGPFNSGDYQYKRQVTDSRARAWFLPDWPDQNRMLEFRAILTGNGITPTRPPRIMIGYELFDTGVFPSLALARSSASGAGVVSSTWFNAVLPSYIQNAFGIEFSSADATNLRLQGMNIRLQS